MFSDFRRFRSGLSFRVIGLSILVALGFVSGCTTSNNKSTGGNGSSAAKLAFTAQPSNVGAGSSIAPAVVVSIEDSNGNVVTTATNQVTIAIGTNPASGTLGGTLTAAAVAGVATFSNLSINSAGTGYTLTATAGTLTGATSSAFNVTAGAAAKLGFTVQPGSGPAGGTIAPAVQVSIEDALGNVVTAATNQITIAIGTNPASGTLSGTAQVNAVASVATFSTLSINNAGVGYTLAASATGLTGANSSAFNVFGAATELAFTVQPSNVSAGASIAPAVQVSIEDSLGSVVTTATNQVTIAIGNNPSSGTLSGTAQVNAAAGVATFSGLGINNTGNGYTLTASATGLTGATSNSFNVTPACGSGSESLLSGNYAFVLKGFDNGTPAEPALVGGVLTFNGSGSISAGAIDMNLNSGVQPNLAVSAGTYQVGSDHRACMTITTSAGTQHYRASLANISSGVASTGHMIDFDSVGPFTVGTLLKQSSTIPTTLSGTFGFGASSVQNTATTNGNAGLGGSFGAVGTMTFASNGALTGGNVDFNQNGFLDGASAAGGNWAASPITLTSGSYTVAANGRGTFSFTPSGSTAVNTFVYVVSSSELLFLSSDAQPANVVIAGHALLQSGAPFSANPLSGAYVGYQSGLGSTAGTSRVTLLLINASGTGITGTQLRNDGGSFQSKTLSGITYSVASSGRMTIPASGTNTNPPIFYLVSSSQVFVLGADTGVDSGFFQSQSGSPFSNTSASGTYAFGAFDPQGPSVNDGLGIADFASPNLTVTEDDNSNGSQHAGQTQSFTYSVDSTGLGIIPSGCSLSTTPTTCTVFYVISPTKAVVMDTGSTDPNAQIADQ